MRAVGLKILKNRLSEYVRIASQGETVLVTDRDKVVAELVPPNAGRSEWASDALLADAVRKGWITPPTDPSRTQPPRKRILPLKELLDGLERDRDDR